MFSIKVFHVSLLPLVTRQKKAALEIKDSLANTQNTLK
jgi:hypothetical protein